MPVFKNLAREYSTTTGTSDAVLTTAVPGCNTWDLAGVTNGQVVRYGIITYSTTSNRPTHSEVGLGTYTTSTKTLARTTVESSTNAGSKITLTGLSEVFVNPTALDLNAGGNPFAYFYQNGSATAIADTANSYIGIDTESLDTNAITTLAANTITVTYTGWYDVKAIVNISAAGAIGDGYVRAVLESSGGYAPEAKTGLTTAMGIQDLNVHVRGLFSYTAAQTLKIKVYNEGNISINASLSELVIVKRDG